jgi:hypothetical protein
MSEQTQNKELDADVDAVMAACDPRAAVRALLVAMSYLEAEVERLAQAVSRGYVRGRLRVEPPTDLASGQHDKQS